MSVPRAGLGGVVVLALWAVAAGAQQGVAPPPEVESTPLPPAGVTGVPIPGPEGAVRDPAAMGLGDFQTTEEAAGIVAVAPGGARLRWLDRIAGEARDLTLAPGGLEVAGGIVVTLDECRYPVEDPAGNAFAHLSVREAEGGAVVFSGWMVADSPALNAMDHRRYDVWVLSCVLPDAEAGPAAAD